MKGKSKAQKQEKQHQNQEQVWDAIAEQWFHFRQKPFPDIALWLDKLVKQWKPGKILEIGCGNCRNLLPFAKHGFECYGVDFSKEMLKYARLYAKKHKFDVKLKQANAIALPFKDKSFDYVLSIAVLHHLKKQDQVKAVKEMYRVLKKDGQAYVSVWNKLSRRWFFKARQVYVPWQVKGKAFYRYYYLFWPWELQKLLKSVGFKIKAKSWFGKNLWFLVVKD